MCTDRSGATKDIMKPPPSARAPSALTLTRRALLGGLSAGSLVALARLPRRGFRTGVASTAPGDGVRNSAANAES